MLRMSYLINFLVDFSCRNTSGLGMEAQNLTPLPTSNRQFSITQNLIFSNICSHDNVKKLF